MKNLESDKLKELVKTDNRFIFAKIDFANQMSSVDTIWKEFKNGRELRGPRISPLLPESELKDWEIIGINSIILDDMTFRDWIMRGDYKKANGIAIFHVAFLEKAFPSMLQTSPCLESLEDGGFYDEKSEKGLKLARNHLSPTERRKVHKDYGDGCYICKSTDNLTIHHIRERLYGGGTEIGNSVLLCHECHVKVHKKVISRETLDILRYRHERSFRGVV
jgi:hypothetical protein